MGDHQQPIAGSSKTNKSTRFRFSSASRIFLKDYFYNTSKAPKKKERQQILAHLKELGDTEVTDTRICAWFNYNRHRERRLFSLPFPPSVSDQSETKWVDGYHETLWPSLTRETLRDLEDLYAELVAENPNPNIPYEPWARILDAKTVHVRMWCKAKERQPKHRLRLDTAPLTEAASQVTEEHSQLPTPGNSISPEPSITIAGRADAVKAEPPASPVVDTTPFGQTPETNKSKTSMGLHDAIESAFFGHPYPLPPTTQPLKPPSSTGSDHQRNLLSINPHGTIQVVLPPTPPLISAASDATTSAFTPLPAAPISSPLQSELSPYPEPCVPPLREEPTPGPSEQTERDLARERATLATGIAKKLDEVNEMFSSAHGLFQYAGSIQNISRRNEQFLKDVSSGRFAHLHLTSAYIPDQQVAGSISEYNPLRVLAEWRDSRGKKKEKDIEVEMQVD